MCCHFTLYWITLYYIILYYIMRGISMSEYLCSRTNANIRYMKSLLISDKRRDTSRCIDHNVTPHDDASITHLHKVAVTSTIIIQEMMASNLLPIIFIHGKLRQHYRKSWSSCKILVGSGVGPLRFQIPILHSIKFWHRARAVKQEHLRISFQI